MDAAEVKEILSDQDIFSLLVEFGGDPTWNGSIISRTCCHNSAHEGKHKLTYYQESKTFHCYTGCGSMDVFGLVQKKMGLDFYNSFRYICSKFGISVDNSINTFDKIDDSYFKKFKKKEVQPIILDVLPSTILNSYYDLYHDSWIKDGIGITSMKKFGIKFSILDNQIIIPHNDIDGNLIGVRARNLNQDIIDSGRKYLPVYWKTKVLKHPTGAALYGLDNTKDLIEKYKTVILFESEKSVLQLDTMFPEQSIGVCLSGSSMTQHQLNILKTLDIDEVVIALDKEFKEIGSIEEKFYAKKIEEVFANKLLPFFRVSIIWDLDGITEEKSSPTDSGRETFLKLFKNRIFI